MKKTLFIFVMMGMVTQSVAQIKPDGQKAWKHVEYLASDSMKGRKSGTPEYQKAAEYVAQKMKEYGMRPAGDSA